MHALAFRSWLALILVSCLWTAGAEARYPERSRRSGSAAAFRLLPLGVYGGGIESNLTAFAIRLADRPEYRVLIDAGSLGKGIARHLGTHRWASLEEFALRLDDAFLTHSHLDHVQGLVVWTQHIFARTTPARIHAGTPTVAALRTHVMRSPMWGDFEALGKIAFQEFDPGATREADGMKVTALAVSHTVPGQGYVFQAPDGSAFVHLGDTGPTDAYFAAVRPLRAAGKLRALSLECSFDSREGELAVKTGHLTPALIVRHLLAFGAASGAASGGSAPGAASVGAPTAAPGDAPGGPVSDDEVRAAAAAVRGTRILVQHVKPAYWPAIRKELARFRKLGLHLETMTQGRELGI